MQEILLYNLLLIFGLSINHFFKKKLYVYVYMFFLYAFRFNGGPDFYQYLNKYNYSKYLDFKILEEPLYLLINKISIKLSLNYEGFVIIQAFFMLIFIFLGMNSIKNYKTKTIMIDLYLILPMLFFFQLSLYRQGIACGIFFYSIKNLLNREKYKYIFKILIAFLFHRSAIFLVLLYFIYPFCNKIKNIVLGFIIIIITSEGILTLVVNIIPKYETYLKHLKYFGLGFLINLPILLIVIIYYKKLYGNEKNIVGIYIIYLLFPIIKLYSGIGGLVRFEQYLVYLSLYGFPILLRRIKILRKNYIFILLSLFILFNISNYKRLKGDFGWTSTYRNVLFMRTFDQNEYYNKWNNFIYWQKRKK